MIGSVRLPVGGNFTRVVSPYRCNRNRTRPVMTAQAVGGERIKVGGFILGFRAETEKVVLSQSVRILGRFLDIAVHLVH